MKKRILKESGIRNINKLAERYKKAKIYFHQDLDGVTTALGLKNYLEDNGIKVIDAEIIQYGDKEFAVKKLDASGDVMPVLVDFAHGKPMFVIHTDHHDSQAGVEQDTATSFKHSRSNVETISQLMSPRDIFPSDDIMLISTVDSANFAQNEITPEMVMNFLFKFDKDKTLSQNKLMMGLVTNKLLLAFKNKPGFLEGLVMNSKPSLLSILNNIKKEIIDKGYAPSYSERRCTFINQNALTVDYTNVLENDNAPLFIDYLSVDIDELSIDAIKLLPHDKYTFGVITIEHDGYIYGNRYRQPQREFLKSLGYHLLGSNVRVPDRHFRSLSTLNHLDNNGFEDWWVHPSLEKNHYMFNHIYPEDLIAQL